MNTKLTRLAATIGGAFAIMLSVVAPAAAIVPGPQDQLVLVDVDPGQNPSKNLVTDAFFVFRQHGVTPQAGTVITATVYSCGQFIQTNTTTLEGTWDSAYVSFSPNGGGLDMGPNSVNAKIGPSFEYYLDIAQPVGDGTYYESYRISGSYSGYSVSRPSCAEILSGTPPTVPTPDKCAVTKWSKAKGKARVGRMAKVTKTSTVGKCGAVSYKWTVNGKTVKTGKKLFLKRTYKGDNVRAIVKVKGAGKKTLNFGRVK